MDPAQMMLELDAQVQKVEKAMAKFAGMVYSVSTHARVLL